jgi:hypothetical protein
VDFPFIRAGPEKVIAPIGRLRCPFSMTTRKSPQKAPAAPPPQEPKPEPPSGIRRKVLQDANDLIDYATLEYTAGSQIAGMKKKIRELTKLVEEEKQTIHDLEAQIAVERPEAGKQEEPAAPEGGPQESDTSHDIEYIVQLEERLKALYAERAELIKASRK